MTKGLTLYPEHVELFRLGLRWIETRGYRTRYRGPIVLQAGARDPDSPAARRDPISRAALGAIPHGDPLTAGAIVLSARLADCVPINERPARPMAPNIYDLGGHLTLRRSADAVWPESIEAQRAFGEFTPGRWGWLLEDIQPTTERCPGCWGCGYINGRSYPVDYGTGIEWDADPCPVCSDGTEGGPGRCAPIPWRGQLGLWEWNPEDVRRVAA